MPPKKKKAAAAAKTNSTRTTGRAAPDTITNNRGKEFETTAAARRATRGVAAPDYNPKPVYAAPTKTAAVTTSGTRAARSTTVQEDAPKKRGPGRPPKAAATSKTAAISEPAKRGRGRPPKAPRAGTAKKALKTTLKAPAAKAKPPAKSTAATPTGRKRGRPSKADVSAEAEEPPKKRGRPSNASRRAAAPAVTEDETAPPKKRGRPPRGGETTKIDTDDAAAAEQLEVELDQTAVDDESDDRPSSKRKAPAATKKGAKGKKTANDDDDTEQDREQTSSGINYWLMKAEQDGHDVTVEGGTTVNTTFTIDDLRAKAEPEPWDGVRNPKAAMNMRNMRVGDMAFFYASGGKQGRKPGITGIMEIVSKAEPDATVNDPRSAGYVVKEADRKKWVAVRVEFRKKLSKPVHLTELQQYKNAELKDLQEFTAARLSVSKVSEKEWTFIYDLIEGFDDVGKAGDLDGELEAQVAGPSGAILLTEDTTFIVTEQPNGDVVAEGQTDDIVEKELDLPKGYAPPAIMQTTEPELPTTDTIFPDATSATERSASRTGSHRSSRAPSATRLGVNSSRPGSRARSLAPPTARGRSRTPGARGGSVGPPLPGMNEDLTGFLDSVAEVNEL